MRASLVRRSALATSVASLVLLATACGGSSDGSDTKSTAVDTSKSASASAEPEQSAVKALTAAELEKVSLVEGDVADLKVEKAGAGDIVKASDVTADKAECLPFAQALFVAPQGKPVATSARSAKEELSADENAADLGGDLTMVGLASYEDKGAADVVAAVRTAATACASGFTASVQGEAQKVSAITEDKVSGGEESAAWSLLVDQEGTKVPFDLALIRQGGTVATFSTFNLASFMGKEIKLEQPTAVIDAQAKKLS
ncbi:hypothetical protein [Streptomyces sp. NPDC001770]